MFPRLGSHVCVATVYSISCPSFEGNCLTNGANPFFTNQSGRKSQRVVAAAF